MTLGPATELDVPVGNNALAWVLATIGGGAERAGTSEAAVIDVGAGILVGNGVLRPTEDAL